MFSITYTLVFFLFGACLFPITDEFTQDDFIEAFNGRMYAEKNITIAENLVLPAVIFVNDRGNGSLDIANVTMKIYDAHDDGKIYNDALLAIKSIDFNFDSYNDLLIYGLEKIYGNDSLGPDYTERLLLFLFIYNPDRHEFELAFTTLAPEEFENYLWCNVNDKKITRYLDDNFAKEEIEYYKELGEPNLL